MKRVITALITIVVAGSFAIAVAQKTKSDAKTATTTTAATSGKTGDDPVVIKFGGSAVRQSEFESAIKTLPQQYQSYASGPGRKMFAEEYMRMKLLARQAEKNGLDKEPEVGMQLTLLRDNALANAQLNRLEKEIKLPDDQLQKVYDEKKSGYEQVKARHILIAFEGSPAAPQGGKQLSDAEAKAKAETLRTKLVGGAKFEELAKTESDDKASGAQGGDLGSFGRGQMVPEFDKAVFEAKPGDILPVVRTQFGYHIIQVQERGTKTLPEVREELEKEVKQKKIQEALETMKTEAKPEFNDAYFAAAQEGQGAPGNPMQMPDGPPGSAPVTGTQP